MKRYMVLVISADQTWSIDSKRQKTHGKRLHLLNLL